MNQPLIALVPAGSSRLAPSAGIATGLVAPLALGAPGNLDTTFADHGRAVLETITNGQAWTVEALDDGGVFVAGGDIDYSCYYWYYCDYFGTSFGSELSPEGEIDPSFNLERFNRIEVLDAVRQADGKVVLAGRRINGARDLDTLVVYRVEADGTLDTGFATDGIFELPAGEHGDRHRANSVVLDPDGRIVVAGAGSEHLIVLRLLADGTRDGSFGEDGVFAGLPQDYYSLTVVERTDAAGYRISSTGESLCRIVGLTSAGALDNAFGTAGLAPVETAQGAATSCRSMASQADGSLVVTGSVESAAFVGRLLATGAPDPGFSADSIAAAMDVATAIAVDGDDRIVVAGTKDNDAVILRLDPAGSIDASFGEAGISLIDLPSARGSSPRINALDARIDGRIVAAGGDSYRFRPFVVELLGDGGADGPGVLGFTTPYFEAAEGGDAVIKVRRTGGKAGSVSVDYTTVQDGDVSVTAGEDYDEVAGTLTWNDGDTSEREIVVPIHANSPEEYEELKISLATPQGGAGLGQRNQMLTILPDGAPAGQFALEVSQNIQESGDVDVWVYRNFYFDGPVSVTVTPVAGTATAGDDFDATPVTLTWADEDSEPKYVAFDVVDDAQAETTETLTVELSNPTGGAILGPHASWEVAINVNDNTRSGGGLGGGGALGWLSLLFLAVMAAIRPMLPWGPHSRLAGRGSSGRTCA